MGDSTPATRAWPAAGSAPLACLHCRRLKMRCIGADNPPCTRCTKSGRECIVQPSRRGHQKPPVSFKVTTARPNKRARKSDAPRLDLSDQRIVDVPEKPSSNASNPGDPNSGKSKTASVTSSPRGATPLLPYTSTLVATVAEPQSKSNSHELTPSQLSTGHSLPSRSPPGKVSDETLSDLLRFFCKKVIYFIPIMDDSELDDIPHVIQNKRFLAYAASLIASEFIPGGAAVREALIPCVTDCLNKLEGPVSDNEETIWTELLAYAILYAYRPSTDISHPSLKSTNEIRLNHWRIKSAIEDFAMRLGLHRAVDGVRVLVHTGNVDIQHTFTFRKAVYWLWLFTMSHHFSLVTETPPTIRQDSSIKTACALFSQISKPARVTRMLAEVDLCMLWNLADQSLPGLGEWWLRSPQLNIDIAQAAHVLDDADAALDVWSRRWGTHGEKDSTYPGLDVNQNGAVEFHFRATRFWMRLFATRMVQSSQSDTDPAFARLNAEFTLKSAEAAECCCRYLMEIDPLTRDGARYMADLGFALIAFTGIYVVRTYEMLGSQFPVLRSYVGTVEACGKMLVEMAVGSNQVPLHYGRRVLEKVANAIPGDAVNIVWNAADKAIDDCRADLQWGSDSFDQGQQEPGQSR